MTIVKVSLIQDNVKERTVDLTIRFSYGEASSIQHSKVPLKINLDDEINEKNDDDNDEKL